VHANAEPRHAIAARDADDAEQQDDDHAVPVETDQELEVQQNHRADEDLEDQEELALLEQIGLTGLVDQLRDLEHRRMHGQGLQSAVDDQTEEQTERADNEPECEQLMSVDAEEVDRRQIRDLEVGFSTRFVLLLLSQQTKRSSEHRAKRESEARDEREGTTC